MTSVNDNEALNMGRIEAMEHDRRYDRADEFMEVVLGHWDGWDDDAIVADKATTFTPIRTRCADSIIEASSCLHAALSAFPDHRKAIPSSYRPA